MTLGTFNAACTGRWASILPALGIDSRFLTSRQGPCPVCGGRDRFRFDDQGKGMWFCQQCDKRSGDGVDLVMAVKGCDFKAAKAMIEPLIGSAPVVLPKPKDAAYALRTAHTLLRQSAPLTPETPAGRWWLARCGSVPVCADLRAHERMHYRDQDGPVSWHPGMIARVRDAAGKSITLHKTYLTGAGAKADVPKPRKLHAGALPGGSAVRLAPIGDDGVLGVAEGMETAVAAALLHGVPTWALLNAQNMEKWSPPECVRHVVVFADSDVSGRGQRAAWTLQNSIMAKSERTGVTAEVRMPGLVFKPDVDWCDELQDLRRASA